MADQVTNYQCPACTGPLHFDGKIGKLKCDYCGSSFTVQEVEKLYAAKNASAVSAKEAADKKAEKEAAEAAAFQNEMQAAAGGVKPEAAEGAEDASGWGSDAAKMRAYNCTSCGAELICDARSSPIMSFLLNVKRRTQSRP